MVVNFNKFPLHIICSHLISGHAFTMIMLGGLAGGRDLRLQSFAIPRKAGIALPPSVFYEEAKL